MVTYGIFDKENNLKKQFNAPSFESACTELCFFKDWAYCGNTFYCDFNPNGFYVKEIKK